MREHLLTIMDLIILELHWFRTWGKAVFAFLLTASKAIKPKKAHFLMVMLKLFYLGLLLSKKHKSTFRFLVFLNANSRTDSVLLAQIEFLYAVCLSALFTLKGFRKEIFRDKKNKLNLKHVFEIPVFSKSSSTFAEAR